MDQAKVVVGRAASRPTRWAHETSAWAVVAIGTAAVWGHTIDEIRIGELSAIPAGTLNLALLAAWNRLSRNSRGWLSLLFGLWWTVAVIPFHVLPLAQGVTTWQNVSGLLRVVGGVAMMFAGFRLLLEHRRSGEPNA